MPSASSPAGLRARWLRRQRRHASLRQVATSRFTPSRRITMAGGRSQHALWPLLGPSLGSPILRGATVRAAGSHMRNERAIGLWSSNCCRLRPNCEALLLEGPSISGAGPDHPSVTVSIGTNLGALQTNRPSPSPVRLSLGGCSLQFGRNVSVVPAGAALVQKTCGRSHRTSVSARYFDTSNNGRGDKHREGNSHEPLHAEIAHVAQRHWLAGWVLGFLANESAPQTPDEYPAPA